MKQARQYRHKNAGRPWLYCAAPRYERLTAFTQLPRIRAEIHLVNGFWCPIAWSNLPLICGRLVGSAKFAEVCSSEFGEGDKKGRPQKNHAKVIVR